MRIRRSRIPASIVRPARSRSRPDACVAAVRASSPRSLTGIVPASGEVENGWIGRRCGRTGVRRRRAVLSLVPAWQAGWRHWQVTCVRRDSSRAWVCAWARPCVWPRSCSCGSGGLTVPATSSRAGCNGPVSGLEAVGHLHRDDLAARSHHFACPHLRLDDHLATLDLLEAPMDLEDRAERRGSRSSPHSAAVMKRSGGSLPLGRFSG
jgi:hypothetical protein